MSHTAKFSKLQPNMADQVFLCQTCGTETAHVHIAGVSSEDCSPDGDVHVWDTYAVMQCRGCKTVSFMHTFGNSEDYDPETGQTTDSLLLYPSRIQGRPVLRDVWSLPTQIKQIYEETRKSIIEDLPILAGIGIRAIIETVCKEQAAEGKNLKLKIEKLSSMQLIARTEANILHSLRFMGNAAAHETKAHSSQELNTAFDIVEHLLNTVYLLEEQHSRLKKNSAVAAEDENLCY
jgi:hypothetical protein